MAKLSKDELLDAFKEMTLIELSEFVKQFEDTFGVTKAAPVAVAAVPKSPGGHREQGRPGEGIFDVILEGAGEKKINVIKEVRALTSLGLKEAKDLVEAAPRPILEEVEWDVATKAQDALEAAGAVVTVKGLRDWEPHPDEESEKLFGIVYETLSKALTSAEVEHALGVGAQAWNEWLLETRPAGGTIESLLDGLRETAVAFVAIWDSELFLEWFFEANLHLDGASPADLIALGRVQEVLGAMDDSAYGVYA